MEVDGISAGDAVGRAFAMASGMGSDGGGFPTGAELRAADPEKQMRAVGDIARLGIKTETLMNEALALADGLVGASDADDDLDASDVPLGPLSRQRAWNRVHASSDKLLRQATDIMAGAASRKEAPVARGDEARRVASAFTDAYRADVAFAFGNELDAMRKDPSFAPSAFESFVSAVEAGATTLTDGEKRARAEMTGLALEQGAEGAAEEEDSVSVGSGGEGGGDGSWELADEA